MKSEKEIEKILEKLRKQTKERLKLKKCGVCGSDNPIVYTKDFDIDLYLCKKCEKKNPVDIRIKTGTTPRIFTDPIPSFIK